jgi:hypothetical protein
VPTGLAEVERGARTLNEIASGFPAPAEAAALLNSWGWQENACFNYAGLTAAGTNSLEVSFHLFTTPSGATEAMSYFAAGRALMLGLSPVPIARVGDELLAIGGIANGENETTIYLRLGAFLIRISAVAPFGDPSQDAIITAQNIVYLLTYGATNAQRGTVESLLPTLFDLPLGFVVTEEGGRTAGEVADTFLRPNEASALLFSLGYQTNVYRYFASQTGRSSFPGSAVAFQVSLHLFGTSSQAQDALTYFAYGRAESLGLQVVGSYQLGDGAFVLQGPDPNGIGIESTVYMLLSNVLARVSAVSIYGSPTADALNLAWVVALRG